MLRSASSAAAPVSSAIPSGKTAERQLLTPERVEENVEGIRKQVARFLDFDNTDESCAPGQQR